MQWTPATTPHQRFATTTTTHIHTPQATDPLVFNVMMMPLQFALLLLVLLLQLGAVAVCCRVSNAIAGAITTPVTVTDTDGV